MVERVGDTDGGAAGLLAPAYRRLSIAIYTTIALISFEGTSVAAALPEIAADLGDVDLLPWVITGYLFALGITTVMAGPLVDALGSQRIFTWSAVAFAGSGFAAGLAGDVVTLVGTRLVQGAASGFLFAALIAAVNLGFPERLTGRAFAANSTIWGIMGAAAPAIAAALLNVASWRWIFFVNLPLGAVALLAGRGRLPHRQEGAEAASIDRVGAVLAAVFTLASILAVDALGWTSVAYAVVAVAAVVLYVRHARRAERPMVSLDHVVVEPYRGLALVPTLMLAAAFATNVYVTVYVAGGRGWSAGAAAWSVLFFTLGWTIGANTSSRLLDRRSVAWVMSVGVGAGVVGHAATSAGVLVTGPLAVVFGGLLVVGVGIGLSTNASLTLLRSSTPSAVIGRASAANQFARSQGFALGAAAGGAILLLVVDRRLGSADLVRDLLAGDDVAAGPAVAAAVRAGFGWVTVVSLAVAVSAAVPMATLVRHQTGASRVAGGPEPASERPLRSMR